MNIYKEYIYIIIYMLASISGTTGSCTAHHGPSRWAKRHWPHRTSGSVNVSSMASWWLRNFATFHTAFPHSFPFLPFLPCRERHSVAHSGLAHMIAWQSSGFCQHSSAPDLSASLVAAGGPDNFWTCQSSKGPWSLGACLSRVKQTKQTNSKNMSKWFKFNWQHLTTAKGLTLLPL
jgi:hypothetical protein